MISLKSSCLAALLLVVVLSIVTECFAAEYSDTQTSCLKCHSLQKGRGGTPVIEWQQSIHAANGISCHDCHGGDAKDSANAMSPQRGFKGAPKYAAVPEFCGKCHIGIRDDFLNSKHGMALSSGGPNCVLCHGSHAVVKASLELINEKRCGACHSFQRAAAIKGAMSAVEERLRLLGKALVAIKSTGGDIEETQKRLFALTNKHHRLFHNINTEKVLKETGAINSELDKIDGKLKSLQMSAHRRKTAGAFLVGGVLILAFVCHLLAKSFRQHE
jgi:nitrate/TMAO reductase-like tetraheme cytochrome c subunit